MEFSFEGRSLRSCLGIRRIFDAFLKTFALISENEHWKHSVETVSELTGIQIQFIHVGKAISFGSQSQFRSAFGLSEFGASLVRPDGVVGWRCYDMPSDPLGELAIAMVTIVPPQTKIAK